MKIRVADITEREKIFEASEPASSYPTLIQAQEAGDCVFLKPIDVFLAVIKEYGYIRVRGTVQTSLGLNCSRCLSAFSVEIASSFTIYLTESAGGYEEDEVELSEQDLLSVTYSGDEIDLENEIAEQVLLELPFKPLCSETCHGLCPICGVDKNRTNCDCVENQSSLAFSSLGSFKVKR